MHLKQIKLAGFKSFVDPTVVPFPTNMTAIVGPNGCGKSNVIDAVRWVMGESSAKNLRGQSMTDVIFNGSSTRKPIGQASIELVFDNADGGLQGEYAQYAEISIKRSVNREAQSHYFLNGTKCRRRDITDVFLGTGLGPRSYSIIEQGMISKLIESKPQELRVFIEEAAGISKYKERRRETENRIRHTRENLERLNDIREELEKRIALLEKQAKQAEQFKQYKAQERDVQHQLHALHWRFFNQHVVEHQQQQTALQDASLGARTQIEQANALIETHKIEQLQQTEIVQQLQTRFYQYGEQIARLEQQIQHSQAQQQRFEREKQDIEYQLQQLNEQYQQHQQALEDDRQQSSELMLMLEQLEAEQVQFEEMVYEQESALDETVEQWNQTVENLNTAQQKSTGLQAEIQFSETSCTRLDSEIEALTDELQQCEIDTATIEVESIAEQLAEETEKIAQLSLDIEQVQQQIQSFEHDKSAAEQSLKSISLRYAETKAEIKSLQQLLAELSQTGDVERQWLEQQGYQGSEALLSLLDVEPEWMAAVEWLLSRELSYLSLDKLPEPMQLQQSSLMLGFMQFNASEFEHSLDLDVVEGMVPLVQRIRSSHNLMPFMAHILTCDSLQHALDCLPALEAHQRILVKEGYCVGPGMLCCFTGNQKHGQLQLHHQIAALTETLTQLEAEYQAAESLQQQLAAQLQHLQAQLSEIQTQFHSANRQQAHQQAHLASKQQALQEKQLRHHRVQQQLMQKQDELDTLCQKVIDGRAELSIFLDDMAAFSEQKAQLLQQKQRLETQLSDVKLQANTRKNALHQNQLALSQANQSITHHQAIIAQLQQQVTQLQTRLDELSAQCSDDTSDVSELKVELETVLEQRLDIELTLNQHKEQLQVVQMHLAEQDKQLVLAQQQLQGSQEKLNRINLDCEGYKIRRDAYLEQIQSAGLSLQVLLEALPEQADIAEWENQLNVLTARIQRLGAINLVAIEEYEQESARKQYLDTQNDDLLQALETLENAIRKIDRETRTKFKETFTQVNEGLQQLFPKVFGGGAAYLELTDQDLLETGVAIMARPPGKKNSTIHLLSGGEKALTAMALVFAIFQLNPAPFCMLDEVDAPLDDVNVGRFCNLVQSMADKVQFIFITHNKVAMEMALQLMGVTMQEPGVSRLVAVDIDEAAKMAIS